MNELRILKLAKKDLRKFLESISAFGELWGPVKKGERYVFEKTDPDHLDLEGKRTILPLKKFFIPPRFRMFTYDKNGYKEDFQNIPNRVVIGVHSCDLAGFTILNKLFTERYPDPYWIERRKRTAIIGVSCIPDEFCFCNETGTDSVDEGFDIFLSETGADFYLVWIGSSLGDDLMRMAEPLFSEDISPEDMQKFIDWKKARQKEFKLDIDLMAMPSISELSMPSKIWDKIGERCLSCGSCSMVCPTCNCYDVRDVVDLKECKGDRNRCWDSCTLYEYSLVAGGHNFRASRADRMRLWYTHKLEAFVGAYGKPSCVGCGRCLVTCPVDINVYTVSKALRGEGGYFK
jgi:sulfhydrogenase subunit beta (sulfur reductase)